MTDSPSAPWLRDLALLALIFGALFFFELGRAPLANPDEGRYAEIPREMAATGDWVTPRLDGVNYFEKPPLVDWAVAANLEAFGPGEWSLRSVPAIFGLGGVLFAYAAGRRLFGRAAGIWSAAVLGTSALYFASTHLLGLDLTVAVLMEATLFCFILGVREAPGRSRRWLFYGLYASAALATLTKGLIGVLVTGAVMFLWLVICGQWKRLRPLYLPTGLVLFLAIALPWHLLAAARNPAWAHFYFTYEQWERFFSKTGHDRYQPWWFFVPIVLVGLFPWTGFLVRALRDQLAGGWSRRTDNAAAWFLVIWAGFIFLFFSKSQSKLIPYILPVFPPLALLIGAGVAQALRSGGAALRAGLGWFVFLAGLLGAAALALALRPELLHDPSQGPLLGPHAWRVGIILLAGGVTTVWLLRARNERAALAGLLLTTALFFAALTRAFPAIELAGRSSSTKPLALQVKALAAAGDAVYNYHEFFHDFTYYAGRTADLVAFQGELEPENDASAAAQARFVGEAEFRRRWAGPGRAFAIARKSDIAELFADPSFHYRLLGETRGHYLFTNQP